MGGDGCNDDVVRGISSKYCYTDYGDDSKEGRRRGMVVGLGGCGIGDHRDLDSWTLIKLLTPIGTGTCVSSIIPPLNFNIIKGPIFQLLMTGSRRLCTQGYYKYNNSYWADLYSNLWKSQRRRGMAEKVPGIMDPH